MSALAVIKQSRREWVIALRFLAMLQTSDAIGTTHVGHAELRKKDKSKEVFKYFEMCSQHRCNIESQLQPFAGVLTAILSQKRMTCTLYS